ncbi:MAG: hypothetical protein FJ161_00415, partial [Gammaproteobacteria bacterium]|nr:hypothetical protein [Gammaproteobacteria bacterium]
MKVFIAATLLLSVMVGFLSHDYLIVSHDQVIYEIPLIYPIMLIIWLFFAGFVLGYQKLSWRQYWLTRKISSYEHLIDVVCQQRDEARWLVCEISRGAIPLRLQEMAADYDMIESPHSTELSAYRLVGYNQKQN